MSMRLSGGGKIHIPKNAANKATRKLRKKQQAPSASVPTKHTTTASSSTRRARKYIKNVNNTIKGELLKSIHDMRYISTSKYNNDSNYRSMIDSMENNILNAADVPVSIIGKHANEHEFNRLARITTGTVKMVFEPESENKMGKTIRMYLNGFYDSYGVDLQANASKINQMSKNIYNNVSDGTETADMVEDLDFPHVSIPVETKKGINSTIVETVEYYDTVLKHMDPADTDTFDDVKQIPIYFVFLVGGDKSHIHITIVILINSQMYSVGLGYAGPSEKLVPKTLGRLVTYTNPIKDRMVGENKHLGHWADAAIWKTSGIYSPDYMLNLNYTDNYRNKIVDIGILTPAILSKLKQHTKTYNTMTINLEPDTPTQLIFTGDKTPQYSKYSVSNNMPYLTNCTKFMTQVFPNINCTNVIVSDPSKCKSNPITTPARINRFFKNYGQNDVAEVVKILNETAAH